MRSRRKDVCANCQRLQQQVGALHAQVATLQGTLRQLQEELARRRTDSSTSSTPPSSDLVKPPKPPPPPEQTQRSVGGQPGHPHHQRPLWPPEQLNGGSSTHRLDSCPRCGHTLQADVPPTPHGRNMAKRFEQHGEAYFEFVTTPDVEPTNNLAEQAIRFVVIDRHVTQGTRGEAGRRWCERIGTVLATCAQQGRSVFEYLCSAVGAFFQRAAVPSLLSEGG